MVADLRSRLPPELFVGDRRTHLVPVTEILNRRVQRDARHTRRVVEHVPDGDGLLAVGAELGPERHDRGVVFKQAALREDVDDRRGRALADRVAVEGGVRGDGTSALRIGDAHMAFLDAVEHDPVVALPVRDRG